MTTQHEAATRLAESITIDPKTKDVTTIQPTYGAPTHVIVGYDTGLVLSVTVETLAGQS